MAEYALGKQLMGGVPVLGNALHRVGEAANRGLAGLGGAAAGFFTPDRVAGLLGDQLLDTVFDTLPQVQDNLDLMRRQQAANLPQEDRLTGGDVALAAAGNFLMNALYNLGSEAVPAALRAIGEKLFANAPLTEAEQQALKEFYAGQDEAVDGAAGTGYDREKIERIPKDFKFSEMTEEEVSRIAETYRMEAPIEIPEFAVYKAQSKPGGYEQIAYTWRDGGARYEVRWHTRTPGAPAEQGATWVVQRKYPGYGGRGSYREIFVAGEWVSGRDWYGAIEMRSRGLATPEQMELLSRGHCEGNFDDR